MAEPITLEQAKQHLRLSLTSTSEDALLQNIIEDARGWVENYTGLSLVPTPVVEQLPAFGAALRAWPVTAVDKVEFVDGTGAALELDAASYALSVARRPATLALGTIASWPVIRRASQITVTLTAGYTDPNDVPRNLVRAMRLLISAFYADRETGGLSGETERAVKSLCRNFKRWTV